MKKIVKVKTERMVDEFPDLSFLGEYASADTSADGRGIDRKELGDMSRNEYRYFIPTMTGEETGNPDSPVQDYDRMEAYNRGAWWMVGIRAAAETVIDGVCQEITSGGLWGIESDSDRQYLQEVESEELAALVAILAELGFSRRAIKAAVNNAERGER